MFCSEFLFIYYYYRYMNKNYNKKEKIQGLDNSKFKLITKVREGNASKDTGYLV
jgi:hypothetical protein